MGIRDIYKVFTESQAAARRAATLAVVGESPQAEQISSLLGAQRTDSGAEVVISVIEDDKGVHRYADPLFTVSVGGGKGDLILPDVTEETLRNMLAPRIARTVDEEHLVPLGKAYPLLRRAVSERLIHANARQNTVIGVLPIPGADMPAITANQARLVLNIAAAYGEELSLERGKELLGVLAAGIGLRTLSRQLVKLVPVAGWAVAGAIAYTGTLAMGQATILYFERGKKDLSSYDVEEIINKVRRQTGKFGRDGGEDPRKKR